MFSYYSGYYALYKIGVCVSVITFPGQSGREAEPPNIRTGQTGGVSIFLPFIDLAIPFSQAGGFQVC